MFCARCGTTASTGSGFCSRCGAALGVAPPPPPPGPAPGMPPSYGPPPGMAMTAPPFACRACGFNGHAMVVQKISTGGWITFGVLLLVFFPLFWIGLLIKDNHMQCPRCRMTY